MTAIKTLIESFKGWKILVFRTGMTKKVKNAKKETRNNFFFLESKNFGAGGDAKLKIFFARPKHFLLKKIILLSYYTMTNVPRTTKKSYLKLYCPC